MSYLKIFFLKLGVFCLNDLMIFFLVVKSKTKKKVTNFFPFVNFFELLPKRICGYADKVSFFKYNSCFSRK